MEYRRKLPHFDHIGACFFVTFRLYNSLPVPQALALKSARDNLIIQAQKSGNDEARRECLLQIDQEYFDRLNHLLDHSSFGDRYLSEPPVTQIIQEVLHEYDHHLYTLQAYCIMPNHIHLLIDTEIQLYKTPIGQNHEGYQYLKDIMRKIKGKTGLLINKERGTKGTVWSSESYDRYIRNKSHYLNTSAYIIQNPVKAGLVSNWQEWPGTFLLE